MCIVDTLKNNDYDSPPALEQIQTYLDLPMCNTLKNAILFYFRGMTKGVANHLQHGCHSIGLAYDDLRSLW